MFFKRILQNFEPALVQCVKMNKWKYVRFLTRPKISPWLTNYIIIHPKFLGLYFYSQKIKRGLNLNEVDVRILK